MGLGVVKYYLGYFSIIFVCAVIGASQVYAERLGNILSDETISPSGHKFYRIFSENITMDTTLRFSALVIKEVPDPRSGTKILVEYEFEDIFATIVYGGSRYIDQGAMRAAMIARNRIRQMQRQKKMIDPDLAANEF